jgi:hypothetical protein
MLALVPLANGYTTAQVQLAVDQTNTELVQALARITPPGGVVAVDLPNDNEYVFEIGLHLRELYGRRDVQVTGTNTASSSIRPGALVAIQQLQNRQVILPRIAAGPPALERQYESRLMHIWSVNRQVQLNLVDVHEPLCRVVREIGMPHGLICLDPVLLLDRREFSYGWDIYRVAG